jgi:hypothetical protein
LHRHHSGRLAPASLAATSLTPLPMMRWHKPVQRTFLAGFAVVAAWLVVPPRAVVWMSRRSWAPFSRRRGSEATRDWPEILYLAAGFPAETRQPHPGETVVLE